MPLPPTIQTALPNWLALANTLADAARKTSLHYFRNHTTTTEIKDDATPVTIADREIEQTLRRMIEHALPEHGICGEEFAPHHPDSPLQWVIDPIDGTRPFMAGIPTFVTLVALAYEGIPILGVIDQPFLQERWIAAQGHPTQCNGKPSHTSGINDLRQATLGTSNPGLFPPTPFTAFQALQAQCGHTVCGGDGYLYARLASGGVDVVCEHGLKPHDFAALVPVIEEAGGVVTDWRGHTINLQADGTLLATANANLHEAALKLLQG